MADDRKPSSIPEEHPPAKVPDSPAVVEHGDNTPAPSGKVIDPADVQGAGGDKAAGSEKAPEAVGQKKSRGRSPKAPDKAEPPGKAPAKGKRAAPTKGAPPAKSKTGPTEKPPVKPEAPVPEPPAPRDASRGEKEEIVYLNLSDLYPFKDHPFGVRDDAEMQGLVESVKAAGVNQPALVRPREGGGYEIIAGHRRQRA
ncbi:ParB N-terminal domain-containing protein, partial [Clostridium phoceensis]|uniref:ParB N-terminal domain-containing protein n=1 Tax=Clostridium phoceensis TaxID=1650661 RepID=UPI0023F804D3